MWITSSTTTALTPSAIALGNFDGIHLGHRQVLRPILDGSLVSSSSAVSSHPDATAPIQNLKIANPVPTVVTFNPHPREFFSGQSQKLLTPLTEKVEQLENLGIQQLVLLPFDRELAALSPQQFVEHILVEQLKATCISVGEDFRFGHQRTGNVKDLKAIAHQFGVQVMITSLHTSSEEDRLQTSTRISSSRIRQALTEGDIPLVKRLLGRPYTLSGQVVEGQKLGRTIGFPTANLQVCETKFLPHYGVYAVKVNPLPSVVPNDSLSSPPTNEIWGVMNLGCRPTVDGKSPTLEVHLLDWTEDLYGQTLTVSLEKFLRPEEKFPSLDALKAQIKADCAVARTYFKDLN